MSSATAPASHDTGGLHVLVLPKWYTGRNDPQLGDFIQKQVMATAASLSRSGQGRVSVVFTVPIAGLEEPQVMEAVTNGSAWELRCYYRPNTSAFVPLRKALNFLKYWRATRQGIRRVIAERGAPHLTHVHILVRPALVAWWLKQRVGIPYLLSEQSSEYLDGTWERKSVVFKTINRRLFRDASAITAVSAHLRDGLVRLGLIHSAEVIPNTVPGMDRPLPPSGPPDRFTVVADLVDRTKNISGVLKAFAQAKAVHPSLRLDVIGDGTDMVALQAQARELGLNGSMRWHGRVSNAEVLTRVAETGTVIVNSNVETFSVVTGEALALGKPVIATRCGGPEAFIHEENGVLIPKDDPHALAEAMIRRASGELAYDPAAIRAGLASRFSPDAVGDAFVQLYQRLKAHA